MMKLPMLLAVSALLAVPLAAQAVAYQFTASLNGTQQVPSNASSATGFAFLSYDDMGTAGNTADDLYSFTMGASGWSGTATNLHIHAPALIGANAGVKVNLATFPFVSNTAGLLVVFGSGVATPYPAFLSDLQSSSAYINIHTAAFGSGEIRGQLLPVAVVPEPSTYALLLAGIGMIGMLARRRRG